MVDNIDPVASLQIWTPVTFSRSLHSFKTSGNSSIFESNSREEGRGRFLSRFYIYLQLLPGNSAVCKKNKGFIFIWIESL